MTAWISVKERLPEKGVQVVVRFVESEDDVLIPNRMLVARRMQATREDVIKHADGLSWWTPESYEWIDRGNWIEEDHGNYRIESWAELPPSPVASESDITAVI